MFNTLKTVILGEQAEAEARLRDRYALPLIDQKIREGEAALASAKAGLAGLIQRQRAEARTLTALESRLNDLTPRALAALAAGDEASALDAAGTIAALETEQSARKAALGALDQRIHRLRESVETTHRRILDLKQGAAAARAADTEARQQRRLHTTLSGPSPLAEAEALIGRVLGRDDPLEQADILDGIERDLNRDDLAERLARKGYGAPVGVNAADVLTRLKSQL